MRPIALCAKIAKKQDGFANQDEQQQLTMQNIKRYFPILFYFSGIQEKRQHNILKKEHVLTIELLVRFMEIGKQIGKRSPSSTTSPFWFDWNRRNVILIFLRETTQGGS